jgi:hypothetical protein
LYKYQGVGLDTKNDAMAFPGIGTTGYYVQTGIKADIAELFGSKEEYETWKDSEKFGSDADAGQEDWKGEKVARLMTQVCHLVNPKVNNVFACVDCLNKLVRQPMPGVTAHTFANHKCPTDGEKKRESNFRMVEQYNLHKQRSVNKSEEDGRNAELREELDEKKKELAALAREMEVLRAKLKQMEGGTSENGSNQQMEGGETFNAVEGKVDNDLEKQEQGRGNSNTGEGKNE